MFLFSFLLLLQLVPKLTHYHHSGFEHNLVILAVGKIEKCTDTETWTETKTARVAALESSGLVLGALSRAANAELSNCETAAGSCRSSIRYPGFRVPGIGNGVAGTDSHEDSTRNVSGMRLPVG